MKLSSLNEIGFEKNKKALDFPYQEIEEEKEEGDPNKPVKFNKEDIGDLKEAVASALLFKSESESDLDIELDPIAEDMKRFDDKQKLDYPIDLESIEAEEDAEINLPVEGVASEMFDDESDPIEKEMSSQGI